MMKNVFVIFLIFLIIEIIISIILNRSIKKKKIKKELFKDILVISNMLLICLIITLILDFINLSIFYKNILDLFVKTACFIAIPVIVLILCYIIFGDAAIFTPKIFRITCIGCVVLSTLFGIISGAVSYQLEREFVSSTYKEEQYNLLYFNNIPVSIKNPFEEEKENKFSKSEEMDNRITYWYEGDNQEGLFCSVLAEEVSLHFYDETLDIQPHVKILYQAEMQVKKYQGKVVSKEKPKKYKKIEFYLPRWIKECSL